MGLDMYAYSTSAEPGNHVDFDLKETRELIHHWCKHTDLHDWMHDLYVWKGGIDPDFNCSALLLTEEDLGQLKSDLIDGFSFEADKIRTEDDLSFIDKALAEIAAGNSVFYCAWW